VITSRPSLEFLRHFDVHAPIIDRQHFRNGWRFRPRLEALLTRKLIEPREFAAACAFRDAWERAAAGSSTRSALASIGIPSSSGGDTPIGSLDDARRIALVGQHLTRIEAVLVLGCVVLDVSWAELGRRLHVDETTVPRMTAPAVGRLAVLWHDRHDDERTAP
jgi:hypothetical protein